MKTWTIMLLTAASLAAAGCSRSDPPPPEETYSDEAPSEPEPAPEQVEPAAPVRPEPARELPEETPPPVTDNLTAVIDEPIAEPISPDDQTLDDASATGMTTRAAQRADDDQERTTDSAGNDAN